MKRNIHDLSEVIKLGTRLGAVEFSVSNVLAHNTELLDENLYLRSMSLAPSAQLSPLIHMPLMDINEQTIGALTDVLKGMNRLEFFGGLIKSKQRPVSICRTRQSCHSSGWQGQSVPAIALHPRTFSR